VLAEDLQALELSHQEVQQELAAVSVLRGERTAWWLKGLKGAPSGSPAQGWSFDALPAEIADVALETSTGRTLEYECAPDAKQDLVNCE
jgi:hypothetical protein